MLKMKKFDVLVSLYIFCIAVAELMGGKTFRIMDIGTFALNASVAIFVLPLIFTINDIIAEVYGRDRTKSIIRSGLFVVFLIFVFALLATALPPSKRFAEREPAYDIIFGQTARIAFSSLVAFALAEFTDLFVFMKIRQRLGGRALWFRNNISNFVSQFLDTTIFMFLAFYAFNKPIGDNAVFLFGLILPYWLLKCFMSVVETPFVYAGVRWLRSGAESAADAR
jgi:uncharacterized integral membrane protein (TIGR00697 family)